LRDLLIVHPRLMKNPEKQVFIPERRDLKAPRAFQPHEFVRNVMGKSLFFCLSMLF